MGEPLLPARTNPDRERERLLAGARAGGPVASAGFLVAVSFGVLAKPVIGTAAAIVMSALVFAGSAQFAALAVLAGGGGVVTAILAGILLNLRFLPMGIALAPSLAQGRLGRALRGQALVDASWALANQGGGRFDVPRLLGATSVQYVSWVSGTLLGLLVGSALGDPKALGLDAIFPAFFLGLLAAELRRPEAKRVGAAGAVIALALIPVLPPGVPILVAALAAGLSRRAADAGPEAHRTEGGAREPAPGGAEMDRSAPETDPGAPGARRSR